MERPRMQGGQPLPAEAPRFQAYLRQQLVVEHQRLRLERSRRGWRTTALLAMALFVLSLAGSAVPRGTRDRVRARLGLAPRQTTERFAGIEGEASLARALASSLEHDGALARELGARPVRGIPRPDHAFVVSRFSMPGGRAVSIYTPLVAPADDQESNVSYASEEGGVW